MRIFVGIKASEKLQNKILKWQEDNKKLPVRFIKPGNLHATLIPPWYGEDINEYKLLIGGYEFKPFEINFDKLFINFKNKVIWIESQNPGGEIFKLHKDILRVFEKRDEKREFKIHITIARFKDSKGLKNLNFGKINWEEKVTKIALFESVLGRKEANYKVLN